MSEAETIEQVDGEVIAREDADLLVDGLPTMHTFEDWDSFGKLLGERVQSTVRNYSALMFAMGDWWLQGEARFGEEAYQAAETTGFKLKTVRNAAWVARKIPPDERRAGLEFSHHDAVAALEYIDRERWLNAAERETLSVQQLRMSVRKEKMDALDNPEGGQRGGEEEADEVQEVSDPQQEEAADWLLLMGPLSAAGMGRNIVLQELQGDKQRLLATFYPQDGRDADGVEFPLALAKTLIDAVVRAQS